MLPASRKDKSQPAKKSAFSRALERLRNNNVTRTKDRAPAVHHTATAPAARDDEFFLVQRCAVTGERFKTLFTRRSDGKFIAKAQMKIEERLSAFVCDDGTNAPSSNIRAEDIAQMPDEPCPCCGRRTIYQHVRCGTCRELVCTGRSYEFLDRYTFVCHDGCGAHAPLTDERITSYDAQRVEAPAPAALAKEKRRALPAGQTKLLGRRQ
jgi:hypothetical protein